jgi:hypothetical protein
MRLALVVALGVACVAPSASAQEPVASAGTPAATPPAPTPPAATPPASPEPPGTQVDFLGYARKIPFAWSASPNAPAFGWSFLPRDTRAAAGEFALIRVRFDALTLRAGYMGMLELESELPTENLESFYLGGLAGHGAMFWRGHFAFQLALSFDRWARTLCAGCAVEAMLAYHHESEHYTGSNSGGTATGYPARPQVGNSFQPEVAFAARPGQFLLITRLIGSLFVPGQSSYGYGTAFDLHLRYTRFARIHPFVSGYGEVMFGTMIQGHDFPDVYRLRSLLGVALPSALGDLMLFGSGSVGYRTGLNADAREATLGLGVRLAIAGHP